MNRTVIFATALLSLSSALAQNTASSESFINARQGEVERLAESLYSTRLDARRWTRHGVQQCDAFAHHGFASFEAIMVRGARFVAIYDLDHAAARSADKPWEGGITLLRLKSQPDSQPEATIAPDALLAAFNRAVAQENAARGSEMDVADEAVCFVRLYGEEPETTTAKQADGEVHSTKPVKITSILIPLVSGPGTRRTISIEFGPHGALTAANVAVQKKP